MAGVIAYDRPVKDFIAQLNATKHVTNTAYRKTSVTFHHNGGRLSLQGVLDVWKVRPASAHFQVDGQGNLGQYVKVNEYAWHAGNTQGNKESIGIELANATLAPDWLVADVTWRAGARLAGWLFARVIGARPTRETVHVHHDWKQTLCAGPYLDRIREQLFLAVETAYNEFSGAVAVKSTPAVKSASAGRKSVAEIAAEVLAGKWGNGPTRSQRLAAAGYSPTDVQAEVNRRLGGTGAQLPTRLSVTVLAQQVIAGQWGNAQERVSRLTAAGYNAKEVQAEVNRQLSRR